MANSGDLQPRQVDNNVLDWTIHRCRDAEKAREGWNHRPSPLPGEGFSSYITRASKANFAEPLGALQVLFPRSRKFHSRCDLDVAMSEESLHVVARVLAVEVPVLRAMIIHLKRKHRRKTTLIGGTRYCPSCLQEDGSRPYFRQAWRFRFVTCCERHGRYLHESCPWCGAPVYFWKTKFDQPITECHACGKSLVNAPAREEFVERESREDPLFQTFQETLLGVFRTGTWQARPVDWERVIQKYWQLAWAVQLAKSRDSRFSWKDFLESVLDSPKAAFKVIFPAFRVLMREPNRLEKPFVCPVEGKSYSNSNSFRTHLRSHEVYGGKEEGFTSRKAPLDEAIRTLPEEHQRLVNQIGLLLGPASIPGEFKSGILVDVTNFLATVPRGFIDSGNTFVLGLLWACIRFYGYRQSDLERILGVTSSSIHHASSRLKRKAREGGATIPVKPGNGWVEGILTEVHGRTLLLSQGELDTLIHAVKRLDFPSTASSFYSNHATEFAEYIYAYQVKCLGRPVQRLPKNWHTHTHIADLRRQFATQNAKPKAKWNQNQVESYLEKLISEGGFNPETCAPQPPVRAFRSFLQANFTNWRSFTLMNAVAALYLFVKTHNEGCALSDFSYYLGFYPGTISSNLKKIGRGSPLPAPSRGRTAAGDESL